MPFFFIFHFNGFLNTFYQHVAIPLAHLIYIHELTKKDALR